MENSFANAPLMRVPFVIVGERRVSPRSAKTRRRPRTGWLEDGRRRTEDGLSDSDNAVEVAMAVAMSVEVAVLPGVEVAVLVAYADSSPSVYRDPISVQGVIVLRGVLCWFNGTFRETLHPVRGRYAAAS